MNRPNWVRRGGPNAVLRESNGTFDEQVRQSDLERQTLSIALQTKLEENRQLRQQRAKVFDCLPVGVIFMNPVGAIQAVNQAARTMLELGDWTKYNNQSRNCGRSAVCLQFHFLNVSIVVVCFRFGRKS